MSQGIKGVIFDIDGVLEYQGAVLPGAVETVKRLQEIGILLRFLTNSTLKSRASCAERLTKAGFQISPEQVVTASYATATYLRGLRPRSCWIMLEREGLDEFRAFHQTTQDPEYVVIGDNRSRFDFEHLNQALRCLLSGSKLIVMIPELVDTSMGAVELNVGAWGGMLERASGVRAVYIGKPDPFVFELTLQTMNLEKSQVVMVGDKVLNDVKGARDFGVKSILLRTGEFKEQDLQGDIQPDYVFDSIQDILQLWTH